MPRYFFNLAPGLPSDEEGEELIGLDEAKLFAHQIAREMVFGKHPPLADERIVVTDEKSDMVYQVSLKEVADDQQ